MRRPATPRARRGVLVTVTALVVSAVTLAALPALAAPRAPHFGPVIEDYAGYVSPERCRPAAKPGVEAFADLLRDAYPDTAWIGISRACEGTPASDHQEGRALDW